MPRHDQKAPGGAKNPSKDTAEVAVARVVDLLVPTAPSLRARAERLLAAKSSDDAVVLASVLVEVLAIVAPVKDGEGKTTAIYRSANLGDVTPGTLRGHQVEIGGKVFQIPMDGPFDDGEVVAFIEDADAIRVASDPATSEARFAKKLRELLMGDVEKFVARRRVGKKDGPGLFDGQTGPATPADPKAGKRGGK